MICSFLDPKNVKKGILRKNANKKVWGSKGFLRLLRGIFRGYAFMQRSRCILERRLFLNNGDVGIFYNSY